jgi:hypothetical protein
MTNFDSVFSKIVSRNYVAFPGILAAMFLTAPVVVHGQNPMLDLMQREEAYVQGPLSDLLRNNAAMINLQIDQYIELYGRQLRKAHRDYERATGTQIPFRQYVWQMRLSANGMNPGPAIQQQKRNYAAIQNSMKGMQKKFEGQREGLTEQQRRYGIIFEKGAAARRGYWPWIDPQTGQVHWVPEASGPGEYTSGGETIYNPPYGDPWIQKGRGYSPMMPFFSD